MSQHPSPSWPLDSQEPPSISAGSDEVGFGPEPKRRGTKRGLLIGGAAGALLLVGGGVFAYQAALAPHGAQPDSVIPASALAYVRFDTDPSAGQKIAATRFLGKLPQVARQGADLDVKKTLWTWVVDAEPQLSALSYTTDVEPWLGDRAALALLPGGTKDNPNIVIALAVKDDATAKAGIDKIAGTAGGTADLEVTPKDGFALLTPKGRGATLLSDLAKGSLATNSAYTGDMTALGDTGIASAWVNAKGVLDLVKGLDKGALPFDTSQLSGAGRVSMALRFDADYVELAGSVRGGTATNSAPPVSGGATSLPDDTMAALQLNGLGDTVGRLWPLVAKSLPADSVTQIEAGLGVSLPGDLQLVLGRSLTLAMPKQDVTSLSGAGLPTLGVKDVTTDGKRVDGLLTTMGQLGGVDNSIQHKVVGDTVFLATTDDYLARLQTPGGLGGTALFTKAVANADTATIVAFADLDALEPAYLNGVPADYRDAVKALSGVGLSATPRSDGTSTFALRVVGN
ncbi:MAG: DUF3352 domain-containing protein [Lapillicoccus sp.]